MIIEIVHVLNAIISIGMLILAACIFIVFKWRVDAVCFLIGAVAYFHTGVILALVKVDRSFDLGGVVLRYVSGSSSFNFCVDICGHIALILAALTFLWSTRGRVR